VAVAQETDRNTMDQSETKKTLIGALRLSLRVGLGFCVFILAFSNPMLRCLIGNASINPEVFAAAQKYVWIRSLSMPASAIIGSAQAACLGMQDVKSPLYITLMAAAVNLIADLILVPQSHPWIGGAAGAAWGTALSQYVAMIIYIRWLSQGPKQETNGISRAWSKISGRLSDRRRKGDTNMVAETATLTESNENSIPSREHNNKQSTTKGFLQGSFRVKDLLKKRRAEDSTSRGYVPYVIPVTTTQVGRCSVYVAMGHVVSSSLGTVGMAANQILTAFFYALIPVADALSQTAQALLPRIFAAQDLAENPREKTRVVRSALTSFGKAALLSGGVLAGIVACIPLATKLCMTSDPAVLAIVNSVVPIYLLIFCFHGIFCASEGILMAQKDLGYLGKMYALYFAVVPTIMLQLKRQGAQLQLQSIWLVFLGYQIFRISAWVGRVLWLFWKTRQAGETFEEISLVTAPVAL
jgi:Na+-driven multidrug efflux pump